MSFEYSAKLSRPIHDSAKLIDGLTRRIPVAPVESSAGRSLLRWRDSPIQPEWPEDIELFIDGPTVTVAIYGGTGRQRRSFLDALTGEILDATGDVVAFEEL